MKILTDVFSAFLIHPDNKYSQHMLLLLGRNWTLVPGQTEFTSYIFP